jgi:hypothetical protein
MQEAAWREPWILFNSGATRAGVAAGEEPKQHQAKEGKESKIILLAIIHIAVLSAAYCT